MIECSTQFTGQEVNTPLSDYWRIDSATSTCENGFDASLTLSLALMIALLAALFFAKIWK